MRFTQALSYLLPSGFAWPRDPASVLMRTLQGVAATFEELDDWVRQAVAEWMPHSTRTRLAEWEEATGLPDPCFGTDQSTSARQQALLVRLRGGGRVFDDSSPACPESIKAVCTGLGADVSVAVNYPFRVGDRVGQRLGRNGILHITLLGSYTTEAAEALLLRMSCVLERVVPARYTIDLSSAAYGGYAAVMSEDGEALLTEGDQQLLMES